MRVELRALLRRDQERTLDARRIHLLQQPFDRRAVDAAARGDTVPAGELDAMTAGQRHTAGAYRKSWH